MCTQPEGAAADGVRLLLAAGADATSKAATRPKKASKAETAKLSKPDHVMLYQYGNPANPKAHYDSTGAEIIRDLPEITHFVAGRQPNLTVEAALESLIKSPSSADDASANWSLRRDVIVQRENDALIREADSALRHNTSAFPMPVSGGESLCAAELLALGSIWFLPADAPRDAALGGKPIRLNATDVDKILEEGDYLRVHNPPRRFPAVNEYDWGAKSGENNDRGVVVAKDDEIGYLIVDKPAGLPVHGTVDNALENVAAAVGRSLLESRENKLREAIANRIKLGHDEEFFDMSNSTDRKKKRKNKYYR